MTRHRGWGWSLTSAKSAMTEQTVAAPGVLSPSTWMFPSTGGSSSPYGPLLEPGSAPSRAASR